MALIITKDCIMVDVRLYLFHAVGYVYSSGRGKTFSMIKFLRNLSVATYPTLISNYISLE
jgi:hypothetical protein